MHTMHKLSAEELLGARRHGGANNDSHEFTYITYTHTHTHAHTHTHTHTHTHNSNVIRLHIYMDVASPRVD